VLTPDGFGTVFEYCLGFYSVEVDGYRKDRLYEASDLILLSKDNAADKSDRNTDH
jgi:hypothetical protein